MYQCEGLIWTDINNLPDNIIPYVANVIEDIKNGIQYDDGNFTSLYRKIK